MAEDVSVRSFGRDEAAVALLFALTFVPVLSVGYTTNDETHLYFFYRYHLSRFPLELLNSLRLSLATFFISARPNPMVVLTSPFLDLLSASYHCAFTMRLVSIAGHALDLGLFWALMARVFASRASANLAAVFFLAFIQNSWDHNLLTSYMPYVYCFGLVLLSLLLFLEYLSTGRKRLLWWSAAAYFLALSYETFAVYLPLFFVLAAARERQKASALWPACRRAFFHCRTLFGLAAAWLLVYFVMRQANAQRALEAARAAQATNPDAAVGYTLAAGNLRRIADVVFCHGISSFPGFVYGYYRGFINLYSPTASNPGFSPLKWIGHAPLAWWLKALATGYATYHLLRSRARAAPAFLALPGALMGLYLIFAPGLPVSLVRKYQDWVASGTFGFINTYFSFYGTVFLGVSLCSAASRAVPRRAAAGALACLAAALCMLTDYANAAFTLSQTQSQRKWEAVDAFIASDEFKALPPGSVIYAPSLFSSIALMKVFPSYWTDYIAYRAGATLNIVDEPGLLDAYLKDPRIVLETPRSKDVRVVGDAAELNRSLAAGAADKLYFLKFGQERKDANRYLLFAKPRVIKPAGGFRLEADRAALYAMSKYREFTVFGRAGGRHFATVISKDNDKGAPIRVTLDRARMDLASVSISNYVDE